MYAQVDTIATDAFAMEYCRFGHGKGTLVILPGLSVQSVMPSADAIAEAYRPLTDDYTVYVFDRRKAVPETYTVRDMANDTAEAMRALGLGRADIFGASQGGMMAMEIAIDWPELVRRLIVGSASARISAGQFGVIDGWIRLAKAGEATGLYLAFGEAVYPPEVFESAKGLLTEAAQGVTREELARFIVMAEGMRGFDITGDLGRITCPVLVIGSKDDKVLGGEASERIAEGLRHASDRALYMYDGYGHAAYDCASDYRERMLRFLTAGEDS